jgi:hypothetical protein
MRGETALLEPHPGEVGLGDHGDRVEGRLLGTRALALNFASRQLS